MPVNTDPEGGKKLQSCGVIVTEGFKVPERLTVGSWLIYDVDSGDVIAAKDPHGRYRPASIFKVLLAREAIDRLPLDKVLTATQEDANMEGSPRWNWSGWEVHGEASVAGAADAVRE